MVGLANLASLYTARERLSRCRKEAARKGETLQEGERPTRGERDLRSNRKRATERERESPGDSSRRNARTGIASSLYNVSYLSQKLKK